MKKIQIFGTGCQKCSELYDNVLTAIADLEGYEVEKVTDILKIIEKNVVVTPALSIDGEIICSGKILSPQEIKECLETDNSCCEDEGCCSDKTFCDINCKPTDGGSCCR